MMTVKHLLACVAFSFLLTACSSDSGDGEHVWKEQTDTIDKAKEVESVMKQAAEDQAKMIEQRAQ